MITLAVECSGRWTNVGLASGGSILSERNEKLGRKQSEELPILVDEVLAEACLKLSDVDLIAVGTGPGYYTGIRTGTAYGAALAEALGLKVAPLSSLKAFIWDIKDEYRSVAPVFKARRGYCYAAVYAGGEELAAPSFLSEAGLVVMLKDYPDAVVVTPDIGHLAALRESGREIVDRESASGGAAALLGEACASSAEEPRKISGNYLRAPDIGPIE